MHYLYVHEYARLHVVCFTPPHRPSTKDMYTYTYINTRRHSMIHSRTQIILLYIAKYTYTYISPQTYTHTRAHSIFRARCTNNYHRSTAYIHSKTIARVRMNLHTTHTHSVLYANFAPVHMNLQMNFEGTFSTCLQTNFARELCTCTYEFIYNTYP
jgi:hypothetical protein